ncbi:MAG: ABC transporter permease [Ruminococcus sp.]|nr:ABC transporter permease [Ruminococcus sp.]
MKQFGKIFKFELKNYLINKVFMGITVFMVAALMITMFFPKIMGSTSGTDDVAESELPVMLIGGSLEKNADAIEQSFTAAFKNEYAVKVTDESLDSIKKQVTDEKAECAFIINSTASYTYCVNNLSMYDSNTVIADEIMQNIFYMDNFISSGISPDKTQQILTTAIEHETLNLGVDQMQNFFYTYIMIFALYMVILLYGQMVATNVATEKSSRAMELLITSANPVSMMFGKVFASCTAGLIQLIAVFGAAFIGFNINKSDWTDNQIVMSIFDMPAQLLVYMLVFFVLGFFIYAFLYGAIGSTVSKLEDINTSVMPVTFMFIIAFFVVVFSMSGGNIDNTLMKVCSFIPFTSPMAMFTRIAMSTVPFYEIVISIAILIASVIGIGYVSAKIYRVGVLLYGTAPKLSTLLKAIKKA